MEFDMEYDPEVMYDLFGQDAVCFTEYAFHTSPPSHLSHPAFFVGAPFAFTSWKEEAPSKCGKTSWATLIPKLLVNTSPTLFALCMGSPQTKTQSWALQITKQQRFR